MNEAPVKGILSSKKNKQNFEKDEASANCKRETGYNQGYGNIDRDTGGGRPEWGRAHFTSCGEWNSDMGRKGRL